MSEFSKPFSPDNAVEVKRLEAALEAAGIGSWELDLTNNHFRICNRVKSLFNGLDEDLIPYNEIIERVSALDRESFNTNLRNALDKKSGGNFNIEFKLNLPENALPVWLQMKGKVDFGDDGSPSQFSGIVQDISQLVQSKQLIQQNEAHIKGLVTNNPDAIARWDLNLRLVFANSVFASQMGKDLADMIGKTILEIGQPEQMALPYMECLSTVMQKGRTDFLYNDFQSAEGRVFFDTRVEPEFGAFGETQGALSISRNISNLKANEARLLTMIEQAPMAIGLLEGKDMIIQVGNDRIFQVWGKDRSIRGMRLVEALPEIKGHIVMDLLEEVRVTGNPYIGNSMPVDLVRNGKLEKVYFDFVYTPLRDSFEKITGVMILASDVTDQVLARYAVEESEKKFRTLMQEAPVALCLFTGEDMVVELANQPMVKYWGKDMTVIGKPLIDAMPELKGQPFLDILADIYKTGQVYNAKSAPVDIEVDGVVNTYYFDFTYKPLTDHEGKVYSIINMSYEVTKQVLAQRALEASEAKLKSVIASAPAAIGLFVGRDLVVEMPNQAFIDIVGKGPDIVGKPLREIMPELESQAYLQILDDVFTSGQMYQSFGTQVNIVQQGVMTNNFYNITYTPLLNQEGEVYAILDIAIDVTEKVTEQQLIRESQRQLLSLFEQSPVAIATIDRNLIFTMANPFYRELVGRTSFDIVGKHLLEAMPELEGQGFDRLLENVIETGSPFISNEQGVDIIRNNKLEKIYVDLTYQPQKDPDGNIIGVFVVATDVTQQVLTREKIKEAESNLRGAVELAELGTWQIDLSTGVIEYSSRLREWFGFAENEVIEGDRAYDPIIPPDRSLVRNAYLKAISQGSDGIFDTEYTVIGFFGIERILHAQGKAYFNSKGEAFRVTGTAQDVTKQRKIQLALEQDVQQRTEELLAANEEMAAINEELASINEEHMATNEELIQANNLLVRSNENLQQFAYVASHDLQEPLRKVQSFGDLLMKRHSAELGSGAEYVERMQLASKRMSVLIEDLLTFSRVATKQDATEQVWLNKVVNTVLSTLELTIQETDAVIVVDELPIIPGDQSQLTQLFQNLLSNALKFRQPGQIPHIRITSKTVSYDDIPLTTKPFQVSPAYYRIDFTDNGIGFDNKYAERIFQVFQRLHGKNQYEGTGIGLAICEKVATNHGGGISAHGEPDKGATFSVFFPL